jgi:hypothetical protein
LLVFNRSGLLVFALAFLAWVGAQEASLSPYRLVAGFGVMALLGLLLELQPRAAWRPRLFWVVPAWLVGSIGFGFALRAGVNERAGSIVLALVALALVALFVVELRKPGAKWLVATVSATAVATGIQLLGPQWKGAALTVLNVAVLFTLLACLKQLVETRSAARAQLEAATTEAEAERKQAE